MERGCKLVRMKDDYEVLRYFQKQYSSCLSN